MGDFFLVGDMDNRILKRLRGVKMEREAIINALPEKMDDIILHLDREMLADIVINK
jgi:hypothetical protein